MYKNCLNLCLVVLLLTIVAACHTTQGDKHDMAAGKSYNPTAADLNVRLGLGYLREGEVKRAKRKLLMALEQAPHLPEANGAMAYFLEKTADTPQADHYYRLAMKYAPGKGGPQNNYGAFLCRNEQYQAAEKYFHDAVNDPEYVNSAEAYENAGICSLKQKKFTKAREYFKKALAQNPQKALSVIELAEIAYRFGNYPQAQRYLTSYMRISKPNVRTAWLGYRIARKLGNANKVTSYAMLLRSQYPHSKEFQQLKGMKQS